MDDLIKDALSDYENGVPAGAKNDYLNSTIRGRYVVLKDIGVGGMSRVYLAHDILDDRDVAIKILNREYLGDEEMRLRFVNEAQSIATVNHPNVVKIYDYYCDSELAYIVMEYVDGIPLSTYIEKRHVLDIKSALHFVVQILRALQYVHDNGIYHRDIKPSNIIVEKNANIKICDFGIAKSTHGKGIDVDDGRTFGSVGYMSPEQLKGDEPTGRSDIYSVGVLLYEMLTGRQPFEGDTDREIIEKQINNDPVRPSIINPDIPVGLEQIILHAIQNDPKYRFSSSATFLEDISAFKSNPNIRFDYAPDVRQSQYDAPVVRNPETKNVSGKLADVNKEADDSTEEEEGDEQKNMIVPIIIAGAVSVVLIVGIILAVIFGSAIKGDNSSSGSFLSKLDVFGWFTDDMIEVPNFLNMEYDEAIQKYPDIAISKTPDYEYNSNYEDGRICGQEPEAGLKVSSDTVIKLTVAASGEMVLVYDVKGMTAEEAKATLEKDGLLVTLIPVKSDEAKDGEVISTTPSANSFVARGGSVYVYYASDSEGDGLVKVPSLIGYDKSAAIAKISAAGFTVGSITEAASTEDMKGLVITQSPTDSASVKPGTEIDLIIGAGGKEDETITSENTAAFAITLPSSGSTGTITVYLNGAVCDSLSGVTFDGGKCNLSITGTGPDNSFKIYADGMLIYSGEIDFSTPTPTFSDVQSYQFSSKKAVPSVVGKSQENAVREINAAGFARVNVDTAYSSSVPAGTVISQTPDPGTKQATTASVTIVVSSGPEQTEPSTHETEPTVTSAPEEPENDTTAPTEPGEEEFF